MKKFVFVVLAFVNLSFGVSLMNYEFFDKQDNIDIVLSFDSAYKPDITRREGENLVIILKGVIANEKTTTHINSRILNEFDIVPHTNATHIVFTKGVKLKVEAVQKDTLTLTLRVSDPNLSKLSVDEKTADEPKKRNFGPIIMILCVLILLVLVYFLMKKFAKKRPKKSVDDTWNALDNFEQNLSGNKRENIALNSNDSFEILDDIKFDKDEPKFSKFEEELDFSDDEPEFVSEKSQKKFNPNYENNDKSYKISQILEEESKDEKNDDEIQVILTKKLDGEKVAVVLKHNGKKHLVVLKDSNII